MFTIWYTYYLICHHLTTQTKITGRHPATQKNVLQLQHIFVKKLVMEVSRRERMAYKAYMACVCIYINIKQNNRNQTTEDNLIYIMIMTCTTGFTNDKWYKRYAIMLHIKINYGSSKCKWCFHNTQKLHSKLWDMAWNNSH